MTSQLDKIREEYAQQIPNGSPIKALGASDILDVRAPAYVRMHAQLEQLFAFKRHGDPANVSELRFTINGSHLQGLTPEDVLISMHALGHDYDELSVAIAAELRRRINVVM